MTIKITFQHNSVEDTKNTQGEFLRKIKSLDAFSVLHTAFTNESVTLTIEMHSMSSITFHKNRMAILSQDGHKVFYIDGNGHAVMFSTLRREFRIGISDLGVVTKNDSCFTSYGTTVDGVYVKENNFHKEWIDSAFSYNGKYFIAVRKSEDEKALKAFILGKIDKLKEYTETLPELRKDYETITISLLRRSKNMSMAVNSFISNNPNIVMDFKCTSFRTNEIKEL